MSQRSPRNSDPQDSFDGWFGMQDPSEGQFDSMMCGAVQDPSSFPFCALVRSARPQMMWSPTSPSIRQAKRDLLSDPVLLGSSGKQLVRTTPACRPNPPRQMTDGTTEENGTGEQKDQCPHCIGIVCQDTRYFDHHTERTLMYFLGFSR